MKYLIQFFVVVLVLTSSISYGTGRRRDCEVLTELFFKSMGPEKGALMREELLMLKNQIQEDPGTIRLGFKDHGIVGDGDFVNEMSFYEYKVTGLLPGDTVDYSGRQFTLGRYLGMGNTTQVYQLTRLYSDWVLRIPFALKGASEIVDSKRIIEFGGEIARLENHFLWTKRWKNRAKGKHGLIDVLETDPLGRFMITKFIPEATDGLTYAKTHKGVIEVTVLRLHIPKSTVQSDKALKSLMELMILNGDAQLIDNSYYRVPKISIGNYLYSPAEDRWILADAI